MINRTKSLKKHNYNRNWSNIMVNNFKESNNREIFYENTLFCICKINIRPNYRTIS